MKNYLYVMITFLFTGLFAVQAGDIIYVKASGSNTAPYATEETAATSLATAVAYAKEQWVEGDPRPRIKIVGEVYFSSTFDLSDIEIFGDDYSKDQLRVNGLPADGYGHYFLIRENVLIHGIRLSSRSSYDMSKGGFYEMTGSSSVISNCWISGLWQRTASVGQELAGNATAGLITHCLFSANYSNNGGHDSSYTYGVGHLALSGTARIVNSIIAANYHNGNLRGACDGVVQMSGNAVMENCVVYGNYINATKDGDATKASYRPRRGGGIFFTSGSPTVRNSIVRNNKMPLTPSDGTYPTTTGEDIYSATQAGDFNILGTATPIIENCNTVEGQIPEGAVNCQTGDPKFANPDASASLDKDFSIAADSPCVDAGAPSAWQGDATDYTGNSPRYQGEAVDIGAYEVAQDVTPAKAYIELGGELVAEKYATATMRTYVIGQTLDPAAAFEWYTSDPQNGSPAPIASGKSATYRFTEGTWSIYLKISNADGAGKILYQSVADAVTVTRGADYYVSSSGSNENTGDIDTPFKTVLYAVSKVPDGSRIKIVGTVYEEKAETIVLENVEVYGDSRTTSVWYGMSSGGKPNVELRANAFLHNVKMSGWRAKGALTLTDETACVSNCWGSGLWFTTGGNPALLAEKGLITHTLFTGCHCNYGPVFNLGGTAKMRNCVLSGNYLTSKDDETAEGLFAISGSAEFENNTFYGNWASARETGEQLCAGLSVVGGSPVIRNNIVRNNKINGSLSTGTICNYHVASGTPLVRNNNSDEVFGENAQTADPKFTDPDADDFTIAADSPCVDAGTGKGWRTTATDHAGNPRIQGYRVDIGAYEYNSGVLNLGTTIIVR